uniref:Cilia- and flagella-associated protein 300 n=1 Tax=Astyanax mexicanus TaxID=7994 RepID=A0A8B9JC26_ASTMX
NDFALNFFQDPCVKNSLKTLDASGVWKPLGSDITRVDVEDVPCSKVSVDIFDPILSSGIVRPSGHIVKYIIYTLYFMCILLPSVQKDSDTKEIRVVSTILKVFAYDEHGLCYPSGQHSEQTFAYLCIDPFKRHVYVLYHSYGVSLFSQSVK